MDRNSTENDQRKSIAEALKNPTTTAISSLLLLLILVILVGNFIIVFSICATKRLHVAPFYFVASLAVADFLVGLFVVPVAMVLQVAIEMRDLSAFTDTVCYLWLFGNIWFSSASILNLCFISWDRYLAITTPLRYVVRMRKKKVRRLIVIVWIASLCLSVLSWISVKYSHERVHMCSTEGMRVQYAIPIFLVWFGFPLMFLIFTNGKILRIAKRQSKIIKSQSNLNLNQLNALGDLNARRPSSLQRKLEFLRLNMEIRTFKLFLIVIGVFVVCWLPFFVHFLISSVKPIELPRNVKIVFISLTYINSACNVFIYGFFNKDFRTAVCKARLHGRPRAPSIRSVATARTTLERETGIPNTAFS